MLWVMVVRAQTLGPSCRPRGHGSIGWKVRPAVPVAGPTYSICFRALEKFSRAVLKACSKKTPSSLLVS